MELDLKFEQLTCFEPIGNLAVSHEESMETAIPDYCPDMARIVETVGQLKIREKKLNEGKMTIAGNIKVTVLYTSEESNGLRSLVVSVPFTCNVDDSTLSSCQSICVEGRLLLAEAKAVTNRKLYVRVVPEFAVSGFRQKNYRICTDVADAQNILLRREKMVANLLTYNTEKVFDFTQEMELPEGNEPLDDVLTDQIWWQVESCKRISNKIVLKGRAKIVILYRTQEQGLANFEMQLPFSQILDGGDPPEEGDFCVLLHCMESDIHLLRNEGRSRFGITARVAADIYAWENKELEYVADLYSTSEELAVQNQMIDLLSEERMPVVMQEATQQLEFGQDRPFAYVSSADCGNVTITAENGHNMMHGVVQAKILYLDESGTPVSTERSMEVDANFNGDVPTTAQTYTDVPVWKMSGQSAQLQIPVTFVPVKRVAYSLRPVSQVESNGDIDRGSDPSLVLRRMEEDKTLWDLGKQYKTDPEMIVRANHLEDEHTNQMLLIPKTR